MSDDKKSRPKENIEEKIIKIMNKPIKIHLTFKVERPKVPIKPNPTPGLLLGLILGLLFENVSTLG